MIADTANSISTATHRAIQPRAGSGKVLVLGQGTSSFLTVIRSLGRKGIEVHVACCPEDSPALKSRYVARFHSMPPLAATAEWKRRLIELMTDEQFNLVLPTNEQCLRAIQKHRDELTQIGRVYALDEHTFDVVFDKQKSAALAQSLGLRVPRSRVARDVADCLAAAEEFGWPLVLKPLSSYTAEDLECRREVVKVYGRQELESLGARILADGEVLAQECFVGSGVGVELLAEHGAIVVAFEHLRVHQPPRGGASSYRKSMPLRSDLVGAASQLVGALDFTGVMMVEFLADPKSDDWRFVEMNGRFWGSLPLAVAAGIDFPFYLYELLVRNQRSFPKQYRGGLYCRNLIGDLAWAADNWRADHAEPTLATLPWSTVIGEFARLLTFREKSDTFVVDDLGPGFAELAYYARRAFKRVVRRMRGAASG